MICLMMIYANIKISARYDSGQIEYVGQEMRTNKVVLMLLFMLSVLHSECGKSAPNSSGTAETMETIQLPEAVYEFPIMVLFLKRADI